MTRIVSMLVFLILLIDIPVSGREGMWIPILLEEYHMADMHQKGFLLSEEDIYNINTSSMKDAVVKFGGGCTGSIISADGLLITNHHCGLSLVQSHSSVENDYLANGFWAMSQDDELPNQNLTVTFLKQMEDVTSCVLTNVHEKMTIQERNDTIKRNIERIVQESVEGTHYNAHIEPFYNGNQYFLMVNEVFRDVRLVGAPPSSIGKFGGDTDNWMWPRHAGDFALFRVYSDKYNQPADYSPDNIPYQPEYYFPVSLKGVEEDDFTLVYGYPGRTSQYVTSFHVQMLKDIVYPCLIDVRSKKLDIIERYMVSDPAVRIQYTAKHASVSNAWKRWQGEIRGLDLLDAVNKKQIFETEFMEWVNRDAGRQKEMGQMFQLYDSLYSEFNYYRLGRDYFIELIGRTGMETVRFAGTINRLSQQVTDDDLEEVSIAEVLEAIETRVADHFQNFYLPLDKEMTAALLEKFHVELSDRYYPDFFNKVSEEFKGDFIAYTDWLFDNTKFICQDSVLNWVSSLTDNQDLSYQDDPVYEVYQSLRNYYFYQLLPSYHRINHQLDSLNRIYMQAMMEFDTVRLFYPDANLTLRVSYGQVRGYEPRDGVYYKPFTTVDGIFEKENPDIYDYRVSEKLREFYNNKHYGRYAANGSLPVCFIATNHTTGGSSGSPVLNSNGELIGVNFDRVWEGVMSDLMFNPEQCRNISIDIRYALFIIEKFAGAGYLLEEMKIID